MPSGPACGKAGTPVELGVRVAIGEDQFGFILHEFRRRKRQHSAVESPINALEAHGLDRCPDHGADGFERYVALAVLGRNIHRLGAILIAADAEAERRRQLKRAA